MSAILRRWQRLRRAHKQFRGRTHPFCNFKIGDELCCCGNPACPEIPRPKLCWERIPLWRYLLHGVCKEHR